MKETEERLENVKDQKQRIRDRYKGVDEDSLDVIPAAPQEDFYSETTTKRVAVYARVSTDDPRQTSSYELQKGYYEQDVTRHPGWKLVRIYADEGISGTSLSHRDEFVQMIKDCEAGKIDLIITKSVSRFSRNVLDCTGLPRMADFAWKSIIRMHSKARTKACLDISIVLRISPIPALK